jgi:hypothetical protein
MSPRLCLLVQYIDSRGRRSLGFGAPGSPLATQRYARDVSPGGNILDLSNIPICLPVEATLDRP